MTHFSHLRIEGFSDCHVQGIAIDKKSEYMYFSFTTSLVKTDLQGNVIGSVKGIAGHLGCLAMNYEDGRVYGSLEYKNDSIGKGILKAESLDVSFDDRFYIVSFDADKITRPDMDAEKDGIMTAVYLSEVVKDYTSCGHRYGCSGIDGITFAPVPGKKEGSYLYVAYGIYSDMKRRDNNHQVLLRYSPEELKQYEKPLNQNSLHESGPEKPLDKYFIFTGNTTYGIQNLEYDEENCCLLAAVYPGKKLWYPNYSMFAVDLERSPLNKKLRGLSENGTTLGLKKLSFFKNRGKISGCRFPFGSTGMIALGEGKYLFSQEFRNEHGHGTDIYSYKLHAKKGFIKEEILL